MWNLICFRLALCMANFETEVYEFLKLFNLSRRALDSVVSHHFLTFLKTRLPVSWLLGKYHSEMKCFFVASKRKCLLLLNRNIDNSPHVNAENCKLYNGVSKRVRDGFARHLKSLWRPCSSIATKWVKVRLFPSKPFLLCSNVYFNSS